MFLLDTNPTLYVLHVCISRFQWYVSLIVFFHSIVCTGLFSIGSASRSSSFFLGGVYNSCSFLVVLMLHLRYFCHFISY